MAKEVKLVETGNMDLSNNLNKNAVFVCYYIDEGKDYKPWKNYGEEKLKDIISGSILMLNRWDGRVGFPGGNVDKEDIKEGLSQEEILKNAAIREIEEELGHKVSQQEIKKMEIVATHKFYMNKEKGTTLTTHIIAIPVSEKQMDRIIKNSYKAKHYGSEISGVNKTLVGDFGRGKGIENFIKNSMATSVREELLTLLKTLNLLEDEKLIPLMEKLEKEGYINKNTIEEVINFKNLNQDNTLEVK